MPDELIAARTALVRLLAAYRALGEHFIDLLCSASDDLDPEQEAAFITSCVAGDPAPTREKARRPRKVPGPIQGDLF